MLNAFLIEPVVSVVVIRNKVQESSHTYLNVIMLSPASAIDNQRANGHVLTWNGVMFITDIAKYMLQVLCNVIVHLDYQSGRYMRGHKKILSQP